MLGRIHPSGDLYRGDLFHGHGHGLDFDLDLDLDQDPARSHLPQPDLGHLEQAEGEPMNLPGFAKLIRLLKVQFSLSNIPL